MIQMYNLAAAIDIFSDGCGDLRSKVMAISTTSSKKVKRRFPFHAVVMIACWGRISWKVEQSIIQTWSKIHKRSMRSFTGTSSPSGWGIWTVSWRKGRRIQRIFNVVPAVYTRSSIVIFRTAPNLTVSGNQVCGRHVAGVICWLRPIWPDRHAVNLWSLQQYCGIPSGIFAGISRTNEQPS